MSDVTPPLWVYRVLFRAYGGRLPKRQAKPYFPYYNSSGGYTPHTEWFRLKGSGTYQPLYNPGLLDDFMPSDHIAWWAERAPGSKVGKCRVCMTMTFSRTERENHLNKSEDCRKLLWQAFHRLRQGKQCVICNKGCSELYGTRFGVYTCSDECLDVYKYDPDKGNKNMKEALRLEGFFQDDGDMIPNGSYTC